MFGRIRDVLGDQGGVARVAGKALKSPGRALRAGMKLLRSRWTAVAFDDEAAWRRRREELASSGLLERLNAALSARFATLDGATVRGRPVVAGQMRGLHAALLFALVRERRPAVVVETGVCNGLSSAVILSAMRRNAFGELRSVDLPEFTDEALNTEAFWDGKGGAAVPADAEVGWLVDQELRDRWRLTIGRSQDVLAPLLEATGPIDIFIHDSEHSYENQMFEFEAGYAALKPGGVLVATDIGWSNAFDEFCSKLGRDGAQVAYVDAGCALLIKPGG